MRKLVSASPPHDGTRGSRAIAGVLLILTTGACASSAQVWTPTADALVGTCRYKPTAEEMVSFSDVSPSIPCTEPHTLETYSLASVDRSLTALGPVRPGPEMLTAASSQTCPLTPIRPYLAATELDNQWGVSIFVKFPTRAEWARGVRRVVCDLAVSAPTGQVPVTRVPLQNIMKYRDSARVRLCRVGNDDQTLVTCDQPHDAERVADLDPALTAAAQQLACLAKSANYVDAAPFTPATYDLVPTLTTTGTGVECWLGQKRGSSTGTLRGGLLAR